MTSKVVVTVIGDTPTEPTESTDYQKNKTSFPKTGEKTSFFLSITGLLVLFGSFIQARKRFWK